MRVTGGEYCGRSVACPPGEIRPAMDRMRESLFAILGDLSGNDFLDLFSGSGIVAIEAASRGAERIVAIEKDRKKRPILLKNIEIAEGKISLQICSAESYLARSRDRFDVVFVDPPFRYVRKADLLSRIFRAGCVPANATVILHHPGDELPNDIDDFTRYDRRKYGGSYLDFYRGINDR